jgi:hypothetical protein
MGLVNLNPPVNLNHSTQPKMSEAVKRPRIDSALSQLEKFTIVVADTGDFDAMRKWVTPWLVAVSRGIHRGHTGVAQVPPYGLHDEPKLVAEGSYYATVCTAVGRGGEIRQGVRENGPGASGLVHVCAMFVRIFSRLARWKAARVVVWCSCIMCYCNVERGLRVSRDGPANVGLIALSVGDTVVRWFPRRVGWPVLLPWHGLDVLCPCSIGFWCRRGWVWGLAALVCSCVCGNPCL